MHDEFVSMLHFNVHMPRPWISLLLDTTGRFLSYRIVSYRRERERESKITHSLTHSLVVNLTTYTHTHIYLEGRGASENSTNVYTPRPKFHFFHIPFLFCFPFIFCIHFLPPPPLHIIVSKQKGEEGVKGARERESVCQTT